MQTYARWLFGVAAAFNIAIGLALIFVRPLLGDRLGIEPAEGANLVLANLAGLLAAMIGVIYAMISRSPERYRPLITLSAIGKGLAFYLVFSAWRQGGIGPQLLVLVTGDLIFAVLFADYLRRTRV